MRKKWGKIIASILCIVLLITGCSHSFKDKIEDKKNIKIPEVTMLDKDGIVSEEVMYAISGVDEIFYFEGTDVSGIKYTWSYNGKQVHNPVEQKLKVGFSTENLDDIKASANNATVGLQINFANTQLAAPAKLSILLTEKWDANKVILGKYIDGKFQKVKDVDIGEEEGYTILSFSVTEVGDSYYLLGGKSSKVAKEGAKYEKDDSINESEENEVVEEKHSAENGNTVSSSGVQTAESKPAKESSKKSKLTCTISIECGTILNHWDSFNNDKADFVPSDGWILKSTEVEFTSGETVYDVLGRICSDNNIHMEASFTPMYGSYYVEGINQLYEFDCGNLSGWMYRVNGWYPNYGCSKYELNDGDNIEWRYTADLGRDVGGYVHE